MFLCAQPSNGTGSSLLITKAISAVNKYICQSSSVGSGLSYQSTPYLTTSQQGTRCVCNTSMFSNCIALCVNVHMHISKYVRMHFTTGSRRFSHASFKYEPAGTRCVHISIYVSQLWCAMCVCTYVNQYIWQRASVGSRHSLQGTHYLTSS